MLTTYLALFLLYYSKLQETSLLRNFVMPHPRMPPLLEYAYSIFFPPLTIDGTRNLDHS